MSLLKKLFMAKKLYQDLTRGKNFYAISEDVKSKILGEYYLVFDEQRVRTGKDQALITDFDEDGIPLNKTYIDVESDQLVYFPISIGQMGLSVFHTYLNTKKETDLNRFIKFAEWYKNNALIESELGARWLTDVPLPQYQNPGPWQSAFAQSRAISILLRGYQSTGIEEYKEFAEKALIPFTISVENGGVMSETVWGPYYEEYTAKMQVLVFNGHIFSLFGVHDFMRVFPDNSLAISIFNSGVQSLIKSLSTYDLGNWTRYNYCQAEFYPKIDTATLSYQRIHIMLLTAMNRINPAREFEEKISTWKKQITIWNTLNAYKNKYFELKHLKRI